MYAHILVAVDGSELAGRALDHAAALAKALGSRLTIVTVTEPAALVEAEVRIACLDAASFRPRPIPNHLLQEITPA